ncbi:hypothetical protein GEV33_003423 [Tenebrio molitor]|uniref:Uncharacterized protein n=1 Tax=Tenebrio molitor TaxID=7067 RepID=A0A8J6LHM7_TENMO|nr:hypothetical protein GEV33_003423 [Tenebrio molitor]
MKTRSQREANRVQRERTLGKNLGAAEPTVGNLRVRVLHEETGRANQQQHFLQEWLAGGVGESPSDQSPSGQSLHQQVQVEGDSEESEIGMCRTFSKATPFIPMNVSSEVLEVKIGQRIAEARQGQCRLAAATDGLSKAVDRARLIGTAGGGNQMHRSYVAGQKVMRSSRLPGSYSGRGGLPLWRLRAGCAPQTAHGAVTGAARPSNATPECSALKTTPAVRAPHHVRS